MSNIKAPALSASIRSAQPVTASSASVCRSTISSASPVSSLIRAMKASPLLAGAAGFGGDQAHARRLMLAQLVAALLQRLDGPVHRRTDNRPVTDRPSPRRTMRVKPSSTRKPPSCGRAISRRQLLVPRSRAA